MSRTLSIREELEKLEPIETDLTVAEARSLAESLRERWEELGQHSGTSDQPAPDQSDELANLRRQLDDAEYDVKVRLGAVLAFGEVLDDLTRAAARSSDGEVTAKVARVAEKARAIFRKFELEEIGAPGDRYDPELHEQVSTAPAAPGKPAGTIVRIEQRGYRHKGSIFRRAQVVVSS
jgi:molecular chaperone GrpE